MKTPRPPFLVVLLRIIKKVRETRPPFFRLSFPFHLAFFFIFLLGLFLFLASRERVVRAATMSETLWGVSQLCDFEIQNPQNSIAGLGETFDDQTASCTGAFAADQKMWWYTAFQPTGLAYSEAVSLELRFFMTGLEDDHIELQLFDGHQWRVLQHYSRKKAPPAALATLELDVSTYLDSPENINQASVRFIGKKELGHGDVITIVLDGARLIVNGAIEPTATPTPTDIPTATPTLTPTPSPTPLLTPTSPTISITPTPLDASSTPEGTTSPTATAFLTATVSLTVTASPTLTPSPSASPPLTQTTPTGTITPGPSEPVMPLPTPTIPLSVVAAPRIAGDPHGNNSGMTDSCSGCHTGHAASGIDLRPSWPEESVCYVCHAGGGSGTNVETAFSSYANTLTGFFKHDVGLTNGVHRL
ncbi:MAG: hypothetical protein WA996_09065, partial [Candidatus Promineifilaceae bacterium]